MPGLSLELSEGERRLRRTGDPMSKPISPAVQKAIDSGVLRAPVSATPPQAPPAASAPVLPTGTAILLQRGQGRDASHLLRVLAITLRPGQVPTVRELHQLDVPA